MWLEIAKALERIASRLLDLAETCRIQHPVDKKKSLEFLGTMGGANDDRSDPCGDR